MQVTDNVYAYLWTNMMENNCNTYVLQGDEGLILIDPGLGRYVPDITSAIEADGLDPDRITAVVCTHGHPDHLHGAEYFAKKSIPVMLTKEEQAFLDQGGKEFFRMFGLDAPDYGTPTFIAAGDLKLAGIDLQVTLTPGHSPGSICLYWPARKTLVTGDVVFSGSIGRTDFPGGSGATLKNSIEEIAKFDAEYLLPGHNELVTGKEQIAQNFEFIRRSFFAFM